MQHTDCWTLTKMSNLPAVGNLLEELIKIEEKMFGGVKGALQSVLFWWKDFVWNVKLKIESLFSWCFFALQCSDIAVDEKCSGLI